MKVLTVLGTRPEIIRLSRVIPLLDERSEHILVHTGQNFDYRLSQLFFDELSVRRPDHLLDIREVSFGEQLGRMFASIEPLLRRYRPDRMLVLGDTNSGLTGMVARRLGIPVYHMEAGNRCYDIRVPEETNRKLIDHISTVLMPYTNRSRENLLREGFAADSVYVTGNPIKEVIDHYRPRILESTALDTLSITPQKYFLVTLHRAENVDCEGRLRTFCEAFNHISLEFGHPIVCSVHPRTRAKMEQFGIPTSQEGVRFLEPFGFLDFVRLEMSAFCLLSDSGTVQEEACILGIPNVTLRDVTERPETLECGSNVLAGCNVQGILSAVTAVVTRAPKWNAPPEYLASNVADTVCRLVLGFRRCAG